MCHTIFAVLVIDALRQGVILSFRLLIDTEVYRPVPGLLSGPAAHGSRPLLPHTRGGGFSEKARSGGGVGTRIAEIT
jgi:hypothetical protein